MKNLLIIMSLLSAVCFADDIPVPAKDLTTWLAFDKPVSLTCTYYSGVKRNSILGEYGDPIWVCEYSSTNQTLHSYCIALFPQGTLFGEQRNEYEEKISAAMKMMKEREFIDGHERPKPPWLENYLGANIKTKPNGQKIFFTMLGFGPGGSAYCAFSTLSEVPYDLMIIQFADAEDDLPPEQCLKNPAIPQKSLEDIYDKVETLVVKQIKDSANQPSEVVRQSNN